MTSRSFGQGSDKFSAGRTLSERSAKGTCPNFVRTSYELHCRQWCSALGAWPLAEGWLRLRTSRVLDCVVVDHMAEASDDIRQVPFGASASPTGLWPFGSSRRWRLDRGHATTNDPSRTLQGLSCGPPRRKAPQESATAARKRAGAAPGSSPSARCAARNQFLRRLLRDGGERCPGPGGPVGGLSASVVLGRPTALSCCAPPCSLGPRPAAGAATSARRHSTGHREPPMPRPPPAPPPRGTQVKQPNSLPLAGRKRRVAAERKPVHE